jgi:hypothetical protein
MYCFHCGKTLRPIAGDLTCTVGQMPLSRKLQSELTALFPEAAFPAADHPAVKTSSRSGIYCPGCGVETRDWKCPSCSTDLRRFAHAFIELHPHWYPGVSYWGLPLIKYEE